MRSLLLFSLVFFCFTEDAQSFSCPVTWPSHLVASNITNSGFTETSHFPMGEETIGNKLFSDANFKDWPGIMPVINNDSRVYHTWVNGDERFYFESDFAKMTELVTAFAKLKGKKEILILPQATKVRTFDQSQSFGFNCQLHLVGGIAKHMAGKAKGSSYWPVDPQLTIHVTPTADLTKLKIPKGVKLVTLTEIKQRYKNGFTSTDVTVRGWGIGFLVNVDPFDDESLKAVADLTIDDDSWVALNALSNIAKFGHKAKPHLPRLKEIADSSIEQNAEKAKKLIPVIEAACTEQAIAEFDVREKTFRTQADLARRFIARVRSIHGS